MTKALLILDLDEVLIYSTDDAVVSTCDFLIPPYQVFKRPHVDAFIATVLRWFDIAIWTHGTEDYAQAIVNQLFPSRSYLKFVWSRKQCSRQMDDELRDLFWVKDLKKIRRCGYDLERVLVLEDDPRTMQRSYGNLISIRPFRGDPSDKELLILIPFLERISQVENVRVIEKRNWRTFADDDV